jgi:hypothetical protein
MNGDNNEGKQILERLKAAEDQLRDAIEDKIEEQRAFAVWLHELSPSDRKAALAVINPKDRKNIPRWRKADARGIVWRIQTTVFGGC